MEIISPQNVIQEMNRLMGLQEKGIQALYESERALAEAEASLDTVEAKAFIAHEGTIADRTNLAKLEAVQARLARDIAKAEATRIRMKLKSIESSLMAVSVIGRQVELEFKR